VCNLGLCLASQGGTGGAQGGGVGGGAQGGGAGGGAQGGGAGGGAQAGGAGGGAQAGGAGGGAQGGGTGGGAQGGGGGGGNLGPLFLKVIAFNDFHGNIATEGPVNVSRLPDGGVVTVRAGGASFFARAVADLRAQSTHSILVSAGDLIGASPLVSKGSSDEPTLMVMNAIGLDLAGVGNHEFDEGIDELLRLQSGQCRPEGCFDAGPSFVAPRFHFLGANVQRVDGGSPLSRYEIRTYEGVKVAFIGLTTESTPLGLTPKGSNGLRFLDEVQTVNQLMPSIRAQGVKAVVVVLHEGGAQRSSIRLINGCEGLSGSIVDLVNRLDPEVDLVVSGHTHQAYNCECFSDGGCSSPLGSTVRGRRVTSALELGRVITDIDLELDRSTGEVITIRQDNRPVTRDAGVPAVEQLVQTYLDDTEGTRLRPIGRISQFIGSNLRAGGDSALGSLVADSQLDGTRAQNSVLSFMNSSGLRASLSYRDGGVVTYEDIFNVMPFGNQIVTFTLTGNQLFALLEQQLQSASPRFLQVSRGFTFTWLASAPVGSKLVRSSVSLNGTPINPTGLYRVAVSDFLAAGGDGFALFTQGTQPVVGPLDIVALESYFADAGVISPPAPRILMAP
jgi:5'-nucleotidase